MFRDVEMNHLASAVFDHEKSVQHAKCQSRHGKEIHGRDNLAVIPQESSPQLAGVVERKQATEIA